MTASSWLHARCNKTYCVAQNLLSGASIISWRFYSDFILTGNCITSSRRSLVELLPLPISVFAPRNVMLVSTLDKTLPRGCHVQNLSVKKVLQQDDFLHDPECFTLYHCRRFSWWQKLRIAKTYWYVTLLTAQIFIMGKSESTLKWNAPLCKLAVDRTRRNRSFHHYPLAKIFVARVLLHSQCQGRSVLAGENP